MSSDHRVLLYGFFGIENSGNEAMLRALIEPVREHFGDDNIDFVVANRHPSDEYDETYGVTSIQNLEYPSREAAEGRWLRGLNPDDTPELLEFVEEVAAADVVVVGPGQFLVETGEYGLLKGSLAQFGTVVTACTLTRTPCFGVALACEPLSSPWSRLLIQRLLPRLDRLTFRDHRSVANLRDAGIDVPEHRVPGDLALAAEAADPGLARAVLDEEDIPEADGLRLAAALRSIYWLDVDESELLDNWAAVLRRWLEADGDRDVLTIPQSTYDVDGPRDDDRVTAAAVVERLPRELQGRVHQVTGSYRPERKEALYAGCSVTLSARLHGAVFSCKQGTPPVVLTFMDKTRGYFDRIEFADSMVDLRADPDAVVGRLEHMLENRSEAARRIRSGVIDVRRDARAYPSILTELVADSDDGGGWVEKVLDGG